jgi:hypothetical protein
MWTTAWGADQITTVPVGFVSSCGPTATTSSKINLRGTNYQQPPPISFPTTTPYTSFVPGPTNPLFCGNGPSGSMAPTTAVGDGASSNLLSVTGNSAYIRWPWYDIHIYSDRVMICISITS